MPKITIAIDGYSSTGKSSVARMLADYLDYVFVDTGAMYRAVTFYALRKGMIENERVKAELLVEALPHIKLHFERNPETGTNEIYLNGENVAAEIRTLEVSEYVSEVATISEVRAMLVAKQRQMGQGKGVVMDGRDIGTVVFPDADLKIFMTADAQVRAQRRYEELVARGDKVNLEEVLENVQERDRIDSSRADSPLRKAEDAIEIDNTETNLEDLFHTVLQLAKDRIAGRV